MTDLLPMRCVKGKKSSMKFALLFEPKSAQHGWIFYDNHGQWVTLRPALPREMEQANAMIELRRMLDDIPIMTEIEK